MDQRVLVAVAVVLIAAGGWYATSQGAPTGQIAKQVFDLSTGNNLEILKVEDHGSLDRVVLTDGENLQETYITKDGQYIVQNPVSVENFTKRAEARNTFLSCLEDGNAQFYGILTENQTFAQHTRMTQIQIQVLGGVTGLQNLFSGPGEGPVQQAVLQNGVVWDLDGNFSGGIMTVPQLESATNCTYNTQ